MWDAQSSGRDGRKALVERAKQDREERQKSKEQTRRAEVVQRIARGWLSRRRHRLTLVTNLNHKLQDIAKLQQVLAKAQKPFMLPVGTVLQDLIRDANATLLPKDTELLTMLSQHAAKSVKGQTDVFIEGFTGSTGPTWKWRISKFVKLLVAAGLEVTKVPILCELRHIWSFLESLLEIREPAFSGWRSQVFINDLRLGTLVAFRLSRDGVPSNEASSTATKARFSLDVCRIASKALSTSLDTIEEPIIAHQVLDVLIVPLLWHRASKLTALFENKLLSIAFERRGGLSQHDPNISAGLPPALVLFGNILHLIESRPDQPWLQTALTQMGDLILQIPESAFSGAMSVVWVDSKNCVSIPEKLLGDLNILTSLGFNLSLGKLCCPMSSSKLFERRRRNDAAWEKKAIQLSDKKSTEPSLAVPKSKPLLSSFKDLWASSSWSRLLTRRQVPSAQPKSALRNVSQTSRLLATGDGLSDDTQSVPYSPQNHQNEDQSSHNHNPLAVPFARLFATLFSRWPVQLAKNSYSMHVLNSLSFAVPNLCERLWVIFLESANHVVPKAFRDLSASSTHLLELFCVVFHHVLYVTNDDEIHQMGKPLHLNDIELVIQLLKHALFDSLTRSNLQSERSKSISGAVGLLLRSLYERHSRKPLCLTKSWLLPELNVKGGVSGLSEEARQLILRDMPYSVPFAERVALFQTLLAKDRALHQSSERPPIRFRVHRSAILEDGFQRLHKLGSKLRQRLYVVFVNAAGHEESGIDAGGLFKEFWTNLSSIAFDQQYGLFSVTEDHLLYPNQQSEALHGSDHLALFEFVGSIVGKALYEQIVIQPRFAHFFLSKFLGQFSFIGDLPLLDASLYKNLIFLKNYDGDVSDLCLTMAITENALGVTKTVDLIPNGRAIEVNEANKHRYVNLVANYHLNVKGNAQSSAFLRGFFHLIQPNWIKMFTQPELQILISGSSASIDISDLKKHSVYANGFHSLDRVVRWFWSVIENFNDSEKALLLKFVTSCERPPLLGFKSLEPKFCLHRIPVSGDNNRLVSASTCFNTLKLPTYSSKAVLRKKLLLSISSGAGFELS